MSAERKPKVPVRKVKNIPSKFDTLLFYDHTGQIFCAACNLYLVNKKKAIGHCQCAHNDHPPSSYKKNRKKDVKTSDAT